MSCSVGINVKLYFFFFTGKKSDGITKMLEDYFSTAPNPYLSALRILVNTSDFKYIKSKMSLGFTGAKNIQTLVVMDFIVGY